MTEIINNGNVLSNSITELESASGKDDPSPCLSHILSVPVLHERIHILSVIWNAVAQFAEVFSLMALVDHCVVYCVTNRIVSVDILILVSIPSYKIIFYENGFSYIKMYMVWHILFVTFYT